MRSCHFRLVHWVVGIRINKRRIRRQISCRKRSNSKHKYSPTSSEKYSDFFWQNFPPSFDSKRQQTDNMWTFVLRRCLMAYSNATLACSQRHYCTSNTMGHEKGTYNVLAIVCTLQREWPIIHTFNLKHFVSCVDCLSLLYGNCLSGVICNLMAFASPLFKTFE